MKNSGVLPMRNPWNNKLSVENGSGLDRLFEKVPPAIENQALNCNPQGQRRRGRPRMTWKRTVAEGAGKVGKTWKEVRALAQKRVRWRCFVEALCFGEV
jgi:hypothetical protein